MSDERTSQGGTKPTSAEQEALRLAREEQWKAQVSAHFGYLETDYGFRLAEVDGSKWWKTYARFETSLIAVDISNSVEFDCVEVELIRLVGGKVPDHPVFINPDTPINYIMLDNVLSVRAPEESDKLKTLVGRSDEQVERALVFLAHAVRTYCDDVLHGDFAIFDVIANTIHLKVRENPQKINVLSPDSAQPGAERPLVEALQGLYPQQAVVVGQYGAPKRAEEGDQAHTQQLRRLWLRVIIAVALLVILVIARVILLQLR